MKKLFFYAVMLTALFASCTSDDLVDQSANNVNKSNSDNTLIGFNIKTANTTRATQAMATANHYEFGVFASKGTSDIATGEVMKNYLVAYATSDNGYSPYTKTATTWSATSGNATTVDAEGLSSWVYETLGQRDSVDGPAAFKNAKPMTKAQQKVQVLKYWDNSYDNTYFFAYAPYKVGGADVTYTANGTDKADFKFENVSSFYTTPARTTDYQVSTAVLAGKQVAAGYESGKAENLKDDDAELINANEALYAATPVAKGSYGNDVALNFQHINAKIKIAFYEDIKGYSVELMDMVPEGITTGGTPHATATVDGIALTPARKSQATTPLTVKQPEEDDLPKYFEKATVDVTGLSSTKDASSTISLANTALTGEGANTGSNKDLYFDFVNGGKDQNGKACIAIDRAYALSSTYILPTTYYALPNWDGTNYITPTETENNHANFADSTGYTLHVSYILHPADGSADTKVYDARVFIPAEKCKWQAGKAYTYVFKITKDTNGSTDPYKVDPATPGEPYVDPSDPRVPEDPALTPIVFDGVEVTDYEEATTGQTDPATDTWEISDPKLRTALTTAAGTTFTYTYPAAGSFYQNQNYLTLNTTTGDFQCGDGGVNDNNFFKNIKKFFDALHVDDVEYIYYNGNYYFWSTENSYWKNIGSDRLNPSATGLSLESDFAKNLYNTSLVANGGKISSDFTLVGAESTLRVYFTAKIKNFLVAALTSAIPTGDNFKCNGYIDVYEAGLPLNGTPSATLYAKANDVKWAEWPKTGEAINANNNNFYKDLVTYLAGLNTNGVESIDYSNVRYTWDNTVKAFVNHSAKLQDVLAAAGYAALINTDNKGKFDASLKLIGTLNSAAYLTVTFKTEITDWNNNVFNETTTH